MKRRKWDAKTEGRHRFALEAFEHDGGFGLDHQSAKLSIPNDATNFLQTPLMREYALLVLPHRR